MEKSKKRKSKEEPGLSPNRKQKQCRGEASIKSEKTSSESSTESDKVGLFSHLVLYIVKAGLGKARTDIFSKQVTKSGGKLLYELTDDVSHLIVDEQMDIDRLCRILKLEKPPLNVKIVKASWISSCLSEQELVSSEEHELKIPLKYLKPDDAETDSHATGVSDVKTEPQNATKLSDGNNSGTKQDLDVNKELTEAPSTSAGVCDTGIPEGSPKKPDVPDEDGRLQWTSPSKRSATADDSDDSSYVPSDDEDYQRSVMSSGQSSSNASTPNASPAKLPVCIYLKK